MKAKGKEKKANEIEWLEKTIKHFTTVDVMGSVSGISDDAQLVTKTIIETLKLRLKNVKGDVDITLSHKGMRLTQLEGGTER